MHPLPQTLASDRSDPHQQQKQNSDPPPVSDPGHHCPVHRSSRSCRSAPGPHLYTSRPDLQKPSQAGRVSPSPLALILMERNFLRFFFFFNKVRSSYATFSSDNEKVYRHLREKRRTKIFT